MAMDFFEEAMRTELLQSFDSEAAPLIEDAYEERWGEEVSILYNGPMVHVFTGPSAATNESETADFRVESDIYDGGLDFTMSVHDIPFSQDEVVDERGNVDTRALSDAYSYLGADYEFDPEKERTRFIQFTPEVSGQEPESFEDRWHVFNDTVEEVMDPDVHFTANGYDRVYTVPLRDTQQNRGSEISGGRELP